MSVSNNARSTSALLRRVITILTAFGLLVTTATPVAAAQTSDQVEADELDAAFDELDDSDPRIIGGSNADPKDYPFYVQLADRSGNFYCGGSLVRSKWILTAAHCVEGEADDGILLRFGVERNSVADEVVSKKIYVHPSYDPYTGEADIALIRLERKPDMNSPLIGNAYFAKKAKRPRAGSSHEVIGFGLTSPYGNIANRLKVGTVKVKKCTGIYGDDNDKINVCAGGYTTTSCQGDSGGPLVMSQKVVAGIVSYGTASCIEPYGVYTRVGTYAAWIDRTLAPRCGGKRVTVDLGKGQKPTSGSDVILGTRGDDIIDALKGNDTICGGGGDDIIYGGPGRDRIDGGRGNDECYGGSWKDKGRRCEVLESAARLD